MPRRTKAGDVETFVAEHRPWIEQTRASFAKLYPPEPFALPNTIWLAALGRQYHFRYEPSPDASVVHFRRQGNVVSLRGRTSDEPLCVAALKRWLATVARAEFEPRLRALSAETGNPFVRMHVRGQRSCWGSHSASGTISINYCLLFLEPELVRYLMIHELCHARHMNHSTRFWAWVKRFEPDYRRLDKALGAAWHQMPVWLGFN